MMWMEDLRNAVRTLRSAPGFALTAILSLSVGIGGTVSMFTVVNSILLKPLAFRAPGKLVRVINRHTAAYASSTNDQEAGLLAREFTRWRKRVKTLDSISIASLACRACSLTGTGRPERLSAMAVSAEYFDTLGVQVQLGRWFLESEEQSGRPGVVILSNAFWRRNFAASADIIGQNIHINGTPYQVVGVTPSTFHGDELHEALFVPDRIDIYLPLRFTPLQLQSDMAEEFVGIARLKPDVTLQQARAELDSTLTSIPEYQPAFSALKTRVDLRELQSVVVGDVHQGLLLLMLSVGLVLLIACVNVANLSLVRSTQRARELAVRAALGASRGDLIRQSLMESVLIALAGTITGFILSQWITEFAVSRAPRLPRAGNIATDAAVLSFGVGICALTTILFGLLPAWQTSRTDPLVALNAGSRGNTDTLRGGRIRSMLIAAEAALGVVLVIGSGLLLRSFHHVMNAPRGFDGHDVMIADLYLPSNGGYQRIGNQNSFFLRLREELISMPGVLNVSVNTRAPIDQEAIFTVFEENSAKPLNELVTAGYQNVTSDYFSMMKVPLRAGRLFRDGGETEQVVVISESAARRIWPGQNPLGKRVRKSNEPADDYSRVVGVVGDVLSTALDRTPTPVVYRPYSQRGGRSTAVTLVIQTALPASSLATPLRRAVFRLDPEVPVGEPRLMTDVIANSVQARAFQTSLLGAFALVAVFLAAIGIYSVLGYSIIQRRKEIGIRIALGADRREVSRFVFENGMTPVVAGLASGLAAASFFARLLSPLLFQVGPLDPATFAVTPLVLILTAALPCWLLARRTARFDPMDSLRLE